MQIGEERPIKNEMLFAQKIADRFKKTLNDYYGAKEMKRMFHPKMHGLLKAEFVVEENLKNDLKVGLFAQAATYPAWVRLSNAKRKPSKDKKKDMRGMAIKLFDVPGTKLLDSNKEATTHDFLLVTAETLQTTDVKDFQKSIDALLGGFLKLLLFALTHPRTIYRSLKQISKCANLLETSFFSMTPYKLGAKAAVKYAVFPQKSQNSIVAKDPSDSYLKERLVSDLQKSEYCFDFMVQRQLDPKKMPIEDPTVPWTSSFEKVATIKIPAQQFDSAGQKAYAEQLSFTPWHALEDHRPLGGVNRARKLVYEQIAEFRREHNDVSFMTEPQERVSFHPNYTN